MTQPKATMLPHERNIIGQMALLTHVKKGINHASDGLDKDALLHDENISDGIITRAVARICDEFGLEEPANLKTLGRREAVDMLARHVDRLHSSVTGGKESKLVVTADGYDDMNEGNSFVREQRWADTLYMRRRSDSSDLSGMQLSDPSDADRNSMRLRNIKLRSGWIAAAHLPIGRFSISFTPAVELLSRRFVENQVKQGMEREEAKRLCEDTYIHRFFGKKPRKKLYDGDPDVYENTFNLLSPEAAKDMLEFCAAGKKLTDEHYSMGDVWSQWGITTQPKSLQQIIAKDIAFEVVLKVRDKKIMSLVETGAEPDIFSATGKVQSQYIGLESNPPTRQAARICAEAMQEVEKEMKNIYRDVTPVQLVKQFRPRVSKAQIHRKKEGPDDTGPSL